MQSDDAMSASTDKQTPKRQGQEHLRSYAMRECSTKEKEVRPVLKTQRLLFRCLNSSRKLGRT